MAKKQEYEKRIKELEENVRRFEEEEKEESPGPVIELVSSILPGLGKLVQNLAKHSPEFAEKLQKAEKEINVNVRHSTKPWIEYHFSASTRPLISSEVSKKMNEEAKTIVVS